MARYTVNFDADELLWEVIDTKTYDTVCKGLNKDDIKARADELNNK